MLSFKTDILARARKCEYDEDTHEFWVNTRTEGLLSREDVEQLTRKRTHEQDVSVGEGFFNGLDQFDELNAGFPGGIGAPMEQGLGDDPVCVTCLSSQQKCLNTSGPTLILYEALDIHDAALKLHDTTHSNI